MTIWSRAALCLPLVALAMVAPGCRGKGGSGDASPAARRYTVRGEVVKLPPPQLVLRHEAIPDFVDASGKVTGMRSMAMPFDLAPGTTVQGVAPGDPVEVVLAVDWTRPSIAIERVRKLPAGTVLRLGAGVTPAGSDAR